MTMETPKSPKCHPGLTFVIDHSWPSSAGRFQWEYPTTTSRRLELANRSWKSLPMSALLSASKCLMAQTEFVRYSCQRESLIVTRVFIHAALNTYTTCTKSHHWLPHLANAEEPWGNLVPFWWWDAWFTCYLNHPKPNSMIISTCSDQIREDI